MGEDSHWRYMFTYKTQPCSLSDCRNPLCWDYHSPQDHRRVPVFDESLRVFNYGIKLCDCRDLGCKFSHNYYEKAYHPLLFKTKPCKAGEIAGKCVKNGIHCSFAHRGETLRSPATIYTQLTSTPPQPSIPEPSPSLTPKDLFQLSQEQGALEARLKQLTAAIFRRKQTQTCPKCKLRIRTVVSSGCGHAVCEECSRPQAFACVVCGSAGGWVSILTSE